MAEISNSFSYFSSDLCCDPSGQHVGLVTVLHFLKERTPILTFLNGTASRSQNLKLLEERCEIFRHDFFHKVKNQAFFGLRRIFFSQEIIHGELFAINDP